MPATTGRRLRRERVVSALQTRSLDALLVSGRANIRYLSGFSGSNGWLLVHRQGALLLTDPRYEVQAAREAPDLPCCVGREPLLRLLAGALPSGVARLGFEAEYLSYAAARALIDQLRGIECTPVGGVIEAQRACKDEAETAAIRRALALAEEALAAALAAARADTTERELAIDIDSRCRRLGAEAMAFETIVAAGADAALPHACPGSRPLAGESPVLVDLGCVVDGYCSDITRVSCVEGRLAAPWRSRAAAVAAAARAAIDAILPGVRACDVDRAARAVLAREGLERYFVHGLGHGVGLEVHEAPRLSARSEEVLRPGMVVTVEPGVYLPGEGGVRLEEMVLVTETGAERLNELPITAFWGGPGGD